MTAVEAAAARTFTRVIGSAIRAAANPSDPGQAFASAFMDDVFSQIDLKGKGHARVVRRFQTGHGPEER